MSQSSYKSLLDLKDHKITISSNNSVVGLFKEIDEDKVFLMTEELNKEGKTVITRYDFNRNIEKKNQYKISRTQEIMESNPEVIHEIFIKMTDDRPLIGPAWNVSNEKVNDLHSYILGHKTGEFNPLGSFATGPELVKTGKAIYPFVAPALGGVATAAVAGIAPPVAGPIATAGGVTMALPSSAFKPVKKCSSNFFSKVFGKKIEKVAENSFKSSGENSYTWAYKLLLRLDEPKIEKDLTYKFSDFFCAESNRHIPGLASK